MILGKPNKIENYIMVNSEKSKQLHLLGFIPLYRDKDNIYYLKTDELEKVVEKIGIKS